MVAPTEEDQALDALVEALLAKDVDHASLLRLHPAILHQIAQKALRLAELGKAQQAERLLADLVTVDARSPAYPMVLGACREKANNLSGAIEAYTLALARVEQKDGLLRQQAQFCRGQARLKDGDRAGFRADMAAVAEGPDPKMAALAATWLERAGASP